MGKGSLVSLRMRDRVVSLGNFGLAFDGGVRDEGDGFGWG